MRERMCASCRIKKQKDDLIKITKLPNGNVAVDPTSKEFGRSVYVCKNKDCIEKLIKNSIIKKYLKLEGNIDMQAIIKLIQHIETNLP